MRKLMQGVLLVLLGQIAPLLADRVVNGAPDWVWGALAAAFTFGGLVWIALTDPVHRRLAWWHQRYPMGVLLVVFLVCGLTGAAAFHVTLARLPHDASAAKVVQLYVDLDTVPAPVSVDPGYSLNMAVVTSRFEIAPILQHVGGSSGARVNFSLLNEAASKLLRAVRVRITSYAGTALFNVKFPVTAEFLALPSPGLSGAPTTVVSRREWLVEIPKIDAERPYEFLLVNSDDEYGAKFGIGLKARGVIAGTREPTELDVVQPSGIPGVLQSPEMLWGLKYLRYMSEDHLPKP